MTMRNDAPLLLVLLIATLASNGWPDETPALLGKTAEWETLGETPKPEAAPLRVVESLETPNQARRRLGLPIEASFPAEEPGASEETPNHRRRRLAQIAENAPVTATNTETLATIVIR